MEISQRFAAVSRSGQATMWKACSARVSQKASMAASLDGCSSSMTLPEMSPTTSCSEATRANMPIAMRQRDAALGLRRAGVSSRQAEAAPTTSAVVR